MSARQSLPPLIPSIRFIDGTTARLLNIDTDLYNGMLSRHPFTRPARQNPEPVRLIIGAERAEAVDQITATLKAKGTEREVALPAEVLAEADGGV